VIQNELYLAYKWASVVLWTAQPTTCIPYDYNGLRYNCQYKNHHNKRADRSSPSNYCISQHTPSAIHLHHVRVCRVIRMAVVQMSLPTLAARYFFNYLYLEAVLVITLIIKQNTNKKTKNTNRKLKKAKNCNKWTENNGKKIRRLELPGQVRYINAAIGRVLNSRFKKTLREGHIYCPSVT
jgi:hypothetical protein